MHNILIYIMFYLPVNEYVRAIDLRVTGMLPVGRMLI
jgi:hypothetical protein